jgi:hypothetical protein
VADNVILNTLECEIADRNSGKPFDPIGDSELFGCYILCHEVPPIHVRPQTERQNNPAEAGIAKEL